MGRKFKDFDAQFAEMRQEQITIQVYGKEYGFPAVIPAYLPLEMAKYEGVGVPPKVMLGAARVLFGEQALAEWSSHADFDIEKLSLLLRSAFDMINGTDEGDPEPMTEDDVPGGSVSPKK